MCQVDIHNHGHHHDFFDFTVSQGLSLSTVSNCLFQRLKASVSPSQSLRIYCRILLLTGPSLTTSPLSSAFLFLVELEAGSPRFRLTVDTFVDHSMLYWVSLEMKWMAGTPIIFRDLSQQSYEQMSLSWLNIILEICLYSSESSCGK